MSTTSCTIPGRVELSGDHNISIRRVTADYHQAIGIPLKRGRLFTDADRDGAAPVVILNESAREAALPR